MNPLQPSAGATAPGGRQPRSRVRVESRRRPGADQERRELVTALLCMPRSIPSKHFYDERGLALFDRITEQPEYYPTRTERAILERMAPAIAATTNASQLVELGSGSATKTRLLIDALGAHGTLRQYVPVDVVEESLWRSGEEITAAYPTLSVHGIAADFRHSLEPLPQPSDLGERLVIFLGGTIGNLRPQDEAWEFLRCLRQAVVPGDWFLLGVDLVKDVAVLEAAYDDAAGVTAEFNRNILRVVNRRIGSDFDPDAFRHRAFWDPANEWVEMRLVAATDQTVHLPAEGIALQLAAGSEIRTEISAKYTQKKAEQLVGGAGFLPVSWHTDERGWFGLLLARCHGGRR